MMGVSSATVHDLVGSPAMIGEGGRTHAPRPREDDAPTAFIPAQIPTPTPHIYIGNIPLTTNSQNFDKIAEAFHTTMQNGEIIVRPSLDVIRDGAKRWSTTAVGYFLGKRPYFHHVNEFVWSVWPLVREVKATANGFFFFEFKTTTAMEEVIEGGPWLFHGQPIILKKWEPGMMLWKLQHT
ncbi:UNVERIFIED_CONTAM: hypothetical protein Slati_0885700 [Sesamum latifolium]|uniref:DUF4283 domain-containing protein n=1 Tax=Sesamum latifolium TaxID=2727402 RepID=A0AAW2XPG4_9LAMI